MVQTLLVQSMQASGAFRLVGRTSLGLFPDNTVLTEIRAFQAEPGPPEGPAYIVRIVLTMTVLREADGALVATRSFEAVGGRGFGGAADAGFRLRLGDGRGAARSGELDRQRRKRRSGLTAERVAFSGRVTAALTNSSEPAAGRGGAGMGERPTAQGVLRGGAARAR